MRLSRSTVPTLVTVGSLLAASPCAGGNPPGEEPYSTRNPVYSDPTTPAASTNCRAISGWTPYQESGNETATAACDGDSEFGQPVNVTGEQLCKNWLPAKDGNPKHIIVMCKQRAR